MQPAPQPTQMPDAEIMKSLRKAGILDDGFDPIFTRLTGGVSSDIWKIETKEKTFCVKRALPRLKVAADWFAPVERNRFEVAWCRVAGKILPGSAPEIIHHDEQAMLCVMQYLDPGDHALWKDELRDGNADPAQAGEVGRRLGRIHVETASDDNIGALFPRADIFQAIRLEPYLEATAAKHADLKDRLFALSRRTADTRLVMIHGDVSPKNILMGPDGPVFLDAECACIGDPAFDLAFCLNHFLLKCLWTRHAREKFLAGFEAMVIAYLAEVTWEEAASLEARAAGLLPGLFLARIDGKSPVEYVTDEADKDKVRHCARALLTSPPTRLAQVSDAWNEELTN
jgi:5-methylthioribose kinase